MNDVKWERQPDGRWELGGGWDGDDNRTPIGNAGLMEYRAEIRSQLIDNGYGDLIKLKDAYHEIDTAEMRRIAHEVYGTTNDFVYGRIAEYDPYVADPTLGNASGELYNVGKSTYNAGMDFISPHWRGPAYEAFRNYEYRLQDVTILEARRLALIGKEVLAIADAVEQSRAEAEDALLGAASLLMAGAGLATATGLMGIVLAAAGAIHLVLSTGEQQLDERAKTIEELDLATIELTSPAVRGVDPGELMLRFPDDPTDLDEWKALPKWYRE